MSTISACVHTLVCLILMKFQLGTERQFISKHKLEMSNNRGLITCIWFRVIPQGCVSFMFSVQLSKQNWKQNWSSFTSFCSISPPIRMATRPLDSSSSSAPHHIISYPSIHPSSHSRLHTHSQPLHLFIHPLGVCGHGSSFKTLVPFCVF